MRAQVELAVLTPR